MGNFKKEFQKQAPALNIGGIKINSGSDSFSQWTTEYCVIEVQMDKLVNSDWID